MLRSKPQDVVQLLRQEFNTRREKNPQYSVRSFARDLGLDNSLLGRVLAGKRAPSEQTVRQIARVLNALSADDYKESNSRHLERVDLGEQGPWELSWECEALLALAQTDGFKPQASWVAERLDMSVAQAQKALDYVFSMGWLKKISHGKVLYNRPELNVYFKGDPKEWKKYRKNISRKALPWIVGEDVDLRHFTAIELPVGENAVPVFEKQSMRFVNDMENLFRSNKNKKEVYCLVVCAFPLSRLKKKKAEK